MALAEQDFSKAARGAAIRFALRRAANWVGYKLGTTDFRVQSDGSVRTKFVNQTYFTSFSGNKPQSGSGNRNHVEITPNKQGSFDVTTKEVSYSIGTDFMTGKMSSIDSGTPKTTGVVGEAASYAEARKIASKALKTIFATKDAETRKVNTIAGTVYMRTHASKPAAGI